VELHRENLEGSSLQGRGVLEVLKRLPLALWGALATGLGVAWLYLKGRRLEAELAKAKVKLEQARATASARRHQANAAHHFNKSLTAADRVTKLEETRKQIARVSLEEQAALSKLPPDKVHKAYLELAKRKQ
jgi:hypothetical protein